MMRWIGQFLPRSAVLVLRGIWYAALIWGIFFGLVAEYQPFQYWGI